MMDETPPMIAKTEPDGLAYTGIPEVTKINYDPYVSRIVVPFVNVDRPAYFEFEGVQGFRMLDEDDLQEF